MRHTVKQAGLVAFGAIAGVLISLNFSANAARESIGPLPVEELRSFADVFNAIKQGYVEPVDDKTLIRHAISGMLANLDPHSTYLDVEAYKDLQESTHGEFGGLGIEVGQEDGFVKVVAPIEDTPAYRAGIQAGDLIIKLDDTLVKGLSINDAIKRMRGKPKTSIMLTIVRKGENKPLEITVVRDIIKVKSVKSKTIDDNLGYVRITQFQEESGADLVKQLGTLFKEKDGKPRALSGLVLDLRNDPGCLLNGAIGVAAAFLPADTLVVSTDGRVGDAKRRYLANPDDYLRPNQPDYLKLLPAEARTIPMVVLVNGGSASASEIVAGALQDHKRAVIVGTQTFGKGSVQSILPLQGKSAIKLTTARYFTPSGRSIQAKGIAPDLVVEETPNGARFKRIREADLDRHLEGDDTPSADEKPAKPKDDKAAKAKDDKGAKAKDKDKIDEDAPFVPIELGGKNDYQLAQAVNLLKALHVLKR